MNKYAPKSASLAEMIYRDIDQNDYLNELYENLLLNYSMMLFGLDRQPRHIQIRDALRFADLLSKSSYAPTKDRDHQWGQELVTLLRLVYPNDESVKYYLGSVLSAVGNYRGLKAPAAEGYRSADVLDGIFYEFDKKNHLIPGKTDEYFFHDQKAVYKELDGKLFSYSGPTSMGKSFVAQTYIIQQIESGAHRNFAILVPTKALINEVRGNLIEALKDKLKETNYRVVTNSGDIALKQSHYFVFVMTPERMNYMLTERQDLSLSFLFVDEAHKISEKSGRAAYYWKILEQLARRGNFPTVIFASPNTPNPELYFDLVPEKYRKGVKQIASKYSPVCQFKYFIDMIDRKMFYYDEHVSDYFEISRIHRIHRLPDIITRISGDSQSIIYCSSGRDFFRACIFSSVA